MFCHQVDVILYSFKTKPDVKKILNSIWHFMGHHAYLVTIFLFVLIVGFLDPNSYYHRYLKHEQITHLEEEIQNYKDIYNRDTHTLLELQSNPRAIEKVARERYFMKKPNEDIYILEEE